MSDYFGLIKDIFLILFIGTCMVQLINLRRKGKGKSVKNELLLGAFSSLFSIGWAISYLADCKVLGEELRPLDVIFCIVLVVLSVINLVLTNKARVLRKENEQLKARV